MIKQSRLLGCGCRVFCLQLLFYSVIQCGVVEISLKRAFLCLEEPATVQGYSKPAAFVSQVRPCFGKWAWGRRMAGGFPCTMEAFCELLFLGTCVIMNHGRVQWNRTLAQVCTNNSRSFDLSRSIECKVEGSWFSIFQHSLRCYGILQATWTRS